MLNDASANKFDKVVCFDITRLGRSLADLIGTLNELQRYAQFGKIDLGILSQLGELALTDIVKSLKAKDFASIRKWTATHDIDPPTFYRKMYDSLYQVLKPESVPQAVLLLADYQYKGSFVADPEIHITALLTELMISCEFA